MAQEKNVPVPPPAVAPPEKSISRGRCTALPSSKSMGLDVLRHNRPVYHDTLGDMNKTHFQGIRHSHVA